MAQPFKLEIRDYNGWRISFAYCGLARFWCGRSGWHISCKFPNAIRWVLMFYLWTKSLFIPGRPILCWSHRNSYRSKMDNFRGKSPLTSQLRNESDLGSHQKSVHFFTLVSFENIKVLYSARTQKIRSSRGDTTYRVALHATKNDVIQLVDVIFWIRKKFWKAVKLRF